MKAYYFLAILFAFISCEKDNSTNNFLTGKWIELRPCDSCRIYEFRNDNLLEIFRLESGTIEQTSYFLFAKDSINITYDSNDYLCKIIKYNSDSIRISGFSFSIIPEIGYTDLKRVTE